MSTTLSSAGRQYLTFTLKEELFAIDISTVREVLDYTKITKIPHMPDFMLGVINLRGNVVPVIDMRLKFGMTHIDKTINTCIVILEVDFSGEELILGALVDTVQEVVEMGEEHIKPPPQIGVKMDTNFIKGMGERDENFIIILETNRIFSTEELLLIKNNEEAENV